MNNVHSVAIGAFLSPVFGHVTYIGKVCWLVSAKVVVDGKDYSLSCNEMGTWKLTVAHRGWPRKVKIDGPTGRKVLAQALFPKA